MKNNSLQISFGILSNAASLFIVLVHIAMICDYHIRLVIALLIVMNMLACKGDQQPIPAVKWGY